jgi:hypothetical protein
VTDPYKDKKRIEETKGGLLEDSCKWSRFLRVEVEVRLQLKESNRDQPHNSFTSPDLRQNKATKRDSFHKTCSQSASKSCRFVPKLEWVLDRSLGSLNLARSSLPSIQTSAESLQPLPAKFLQLPISQGRINQGSKSKPNIVAHIATVISNRFRDRACEVVLSHTEDRPHPTNTECHYSCYPNGQFLLPVPITPDESGLHLSAEYELLFESDRYPKNNP